jgi:hypothetical protein
MMSSQTFFVRWSNRGVLRNDNDHDCDELQVRPHLIYRGSDADPKETFLHHPAKLRGPAFLGSPVLRDRDADLFTQPELWSTRAPAGERTERVYHCADFRGNISAMVSAAGELVEQYRYSPTGVPFGIPLGDVDADGAADRATVATSCEFESPLSADADAPRRPPAPSRTPTRRGWAPRRTPSC